ncbi:MAG: hypothetical protein K2X27_05795 [Candidatus Obscuribacterales bacterium]|nr:hypothetical protein [Candidatus Obscuribacterales bacterium]
MQKKPASFNFVFSGKWWLSALAFISPFLKELIIPAVLFAVSNICSVYADNLMHDNLDLGSIASGEGNLSKLGALLIALLLSTTLSLLSGLLALSMWLKRLTCIAGLYLGESSKSMKEALAELKTQGSYLTKVWLFGLLYLLAPLLILSICISIKLVAGAAISIYAEPLLTIPTYFEAPLNLSILILSLLIADYSLILTGLSAEGIIDPKKAAADALKLLFCNFAGLSVLNIFLLVLNLFISAGFFVFYLLPQFGNLCKDLSFGIACQSWLAASTIYTWPLSLLLFIEYLKPMLLEQNEQDSPTESISHD